MVDIPPDPVNRLSLRRLCYRARQISPLGPQPVLSHQSVPRSAECRSSGGAADIALATLQGFRDKPPFKLVDSRVAHLLFEPLELLPVSRRLAHDRSRHCLPNFLGKMLWLNAILIAKNSQPLDDVSQFADIARPGVAVHQAYRLGAESLRLQPIFLAEVLRKDIASRGILPCRLRSGGK